MGFPTETMVGIMLIERVHNLSGEQVRFPLLMVEPSARFRPVEGGQDSESHVVVELRLSFWPDWARALFDSLNAGLPSH